jgi:hypothetical protein
MITTIKKKIQAYVGWCPNATMTQRPSSITKDAGYDTILKKRGDNPPPGDIDPAGGETHHYQDNMLLIILAVAWLFPVVYQRDFLPIILVLSAVAMYVDARNIHAGESFEKETLFGDIVTWQPLTWGLATFVGGIIIMAIYLFHRKEIYHANKG